jgi:AcrR family transcriptional regulator
VTESRTDAPRTRLSAPQRRRQLLSVAGDLFAANGYHGLSMEQLAEAAGVSKPVLYQHFPSKRDLYLALVNAANTDLEERIGRALEGTTDNRERITQAIGTYFDFVEDRRFQLLFSTAQLADDEVREAIEGALSRVAQAIGRLIAHDAGLSHGAANFLAAAVRGLATDGGRWWVERRDLDKAEAVRLLARLVWRGLGSFEPTGTGRGEPQQAR